MGAAASVPAEVTQAEARLLAGPAWNDAWEPHFASTGGTVSKPVALMLWAMDAQVKAMDAQVKARGAAGAAAADAARAGAPGAAERLADSVAADALLRRAELAEAAASDAARRADALEAEVRAVIDASAAVGARRRPDGDDAAISDPTQRRLGAAEAADGEPTRRRFVDAKTADGAHARLRSAAAEAADGIDCAHGALVGRVDALRRFPAQRADLEALHGDVDVRRGDDAGRRELVKRIAALERGARRADDHPGTLLRRLDDEKRRPIDELRWAIDAEQRRYFDDDRRRPYEDERRRPFDDERRRPYEDERRRAYDDERRRPDATEPQMSMALRRFDEAERADLDALEARRGASAADRRVGAALEREVRWAEDRADATDARGSDAEKRRFDESKPRSSDSDSDSDSDDEQQRQFYNEKRRFVDDEKRRPFDDDERRPIDDYRRRPYDDDHRRPVDDEKRRPYDAEQRRPYEQRRRPYDAERRPYDEQRRRPDAMEPQITMAQHAHLDALHADVETQRGPSDADRRELVDRVDALRREAERADVDARRGANDADRHELLDRIAALEREARRADQAGTTLRRLEDEMRRPFDDVQQGPFDDERRRPDAAEPQMALRRSVEVLEVSAGERGRTHAAPAQAELRGLVGALQQQLGDARIDGPRRSAPPPGDAPRQSQPQQSQQGARPELAAREPAATDDTSPRPELEAAPPDGAAFAAEASAAAAPLQPVPEEAHPLRDLDFALRVSRGETGGDVVSLGRGRGLSTAPDASAALALRCVAVASKPHTYLLFHVAEKRYVGFTENGFLFCRYPRSEAKEVFVSGEGTLQTNHGAVQLSEDGKWLRVTGSGPAAVVALLPR